MTAITLGNEKPRSQRTPPANCPPGVRVATKADEEALYKLVLNGVGKEMAFAPVNEARVRALVQEVTRPAVSATTPRPVVAVIDGPNGEVVAAAPLVPRQWWYSNEWHFIQPWIYVAEDHRKGPYARTLVETVLWWGNRAGLPVIMIAPSSEEMRGRREVYARYATPFGGSFVHTGGQATPMSRPKNVRIADVSDYALVMDFCAMLNIENASAKLDVSRLQEVVSLGLQHKNGVIAIVMDDNGAPVGCVCLALDQWDYSLSWHYTEMWVFIHPNHRKSHYAQDVLNFCKWWAEQSGLPVTVGIMSRDRTKAKMRFYAQKMKPLEVFFWHDPRNHGTEAGA